MKSASSRWPARGRRARLVFMVLFASFAALGPYVLIEFIIWPTSRANDYFAFYSFSSFIHRHPAALIYDTHLLEQLQVGLHGRMFPYLYPPGMLLLVWPLADLPYLAGWLSWIGIGLLGYVAALGVAGRNRAAMIAAVVAPSTLWTTLCGQTALFGAALLFGGFRLLPRRPIMAGMLFAMLTYKPQLAVLVPVALAAAGRWRCLVAMFAWACMLALASAVAFGVAVWGAWLHDIPALGSRIARDMLTFCPVMATVTSNLLVFGVPAADAHAVQLLVAGAAAVAVWTCLRRGVTMLGAAAVAAATFLVTPYAFAYDMPLLTAAVIVVASDCYERDGSFAFWEVLVLLAGFLLPFCVVVPAVFRFGSLVVTALLWLIVRRASLVGGCAVRAASPAGHTSLA